MTVGVEERQKVASSARERDTLFESSKSDESIFFYRPSRFVRGRVGKFLSIVWDKTSGNKKRQLVLRRQK